MGTPSLSADGKLSIESSSTVFISKHDAEKSEANEKIVRIPESNAILHPGSIS